VLLCLLTATLAANCIALCAPAFAISVITRMNDARAAEQALSRRGGRIFVESGGESVGIVGIDVVAGNGSRLNLPVFMSDRMTISYHLLRRRITALYRKYRQLRGRRRQL